jgi:PIN domain nuclease of toxin-antitoxin system
MLLLDSQVAIWVVDDNPRLGSKARSLIESATAVHISAATIWELHIKAMLGKLQLPDGVRAKLRDQGFVELPVNGDHAETIRLFPEIVNHDPFDRLLVAQASHAGLDLLTADRRLLGLGRDFIVDARV